MPGLKKLLSFFYFSFIFFSAFSSDSCHLRISLLTCSPGQELYSTFGHSALRVKDNSTGIDIIYNYGTFEFGPDFYTKFIKGRLIYFLSTENFSDFAAAYQSESRSIKEQNLLLTCTEKQKLFLALQTNALEQNKFYAYDFLYDNCSTRLRDIVARNTNTQISWGNILPDKIPTFRNLIHSYLNKAGQYWSKFGIDLLLGSPLDKKMTNQQAMFLPDYLLSGFARASLPNRALASAPQSILSMPATPKGNDLFSPKVVFSMLLFVIIILSFLPNKKTQKFIVVFDTIFFLLLGLIGILLLFMWFGTDHFVCRNNFNLLWALPSHTVAAFFLRKPGGWMHYYLLATIILQAALLIGWIFIPQELNLAILPIILLVLLRSWLLILKPHAYANNKMG